MIREILSARNVVLRKGYCERRMSQERSEVLRWMQEYENANTKTHRDTCRKMIDIHLKRHEYYGNR